MFCVLRVCVCVSCACCLLRVDLYVCVFVCVLRMFCVVRVFRVLAFPDSSSVLAGNSARCGRAKASKDKLGNLSSRSMGGNCCT